jgi:hypothetical protein
MDYIYINLIIPYKYDLILQIKIDYEMLYIFLFQIGLTNSFALKKLHYWRENNLTFCEYNNIGVNMIYFLLIIFVLVIITIIAYVILLFSLL